MKKPEAQKLATIRANLIIEYIDQIISYNDSANITLDICKTAQGPMCAIRIENKEGNFQKYLNTGISSTHKEVFFIQTLNVLSDYYLENDNLEISSFYDMEGLPSYRFTGIDISNKASAIVKVNFIGSSHMADFKQIVDNYNQKIAQKAKNIENGQQKNH